MPETGEPAGPARGAFVNARVLPMGPPRDGRPGWQHEAQGLLWEDDTIVLVGSTQAIREAALQRGIVPTDAGGRIVLPGFIDAHTHFLHVGVKATRPDLRGATSLKEALARLATFLRANPGGHHVIGEGWDESEWPGGRRPTRDDLDAIIAAAARDGAGPLDRPVVLRRICGHIAVASSGALPAIRARWDDEAAVNLGTGLLLEAPSLYLNEVLPSTPEELDRAVQKACQTAHGLGITTVGDYSQAPYRAALQRAAARGTLSVRVASSIYVQQLEPEIATGFRTGRPGAGPDGDSKWLQDGGLKVFLDGSLGAHTAHLRDPYLDAPQAPHGHAAHVQPHDPASAGDVHASFGSRIWADAELDRFFGISHAHGIQVHAHAIGDAAIDQGLDAFARLAAHEDLEGRGWVVEAMPRMATSAADDGGLRDPLPASNEGLLAKAHAMNRPATIPNPAPAPSNSASLRHRFEHYEIVHDEQMARTSELGLVASSQPNFVGEWSAKGGMYEARLGARFGLNNRFQDILAHGIALAFGSDGMPFSPLVGLNSAIHHPDESQRLTPEQAIWHYTTAAAWSLHWKNIGSLLPGHLADFVLLDQKDLHGDARDWSISRVVIGGHDFFKV